MDDVERQLRDLGERTAESVRHGEVPRARIVRRARVRRAITVAAPLATIVLFAGVAIPRVDWPGGRETSRSFATLAQAVEDTEDTGSARVEIEFEFQWGSEVMSSNASGVMDFDTGLAGLQVTYSGRGQERVVDTVVDGTRVLERPVDSPDGKWREVGLPREATAAPPNLRPADFLSYIEFMAAEVTRVGTEVRDGEPMTHYRVILDPAKALSGAGELPEDLEVVHDPTHVWVDEDGRLREMTFGGTTTMDDFATTMRGSMRLFDFGMPVDVEVPAPGEITTEPEPHDTREPPSPGDVAGTNLVTGRNSTREAYAIVTSVNDEVPYVCVQTMDARPARAVIVVEETGRAAATLERERFASSATHHKVRSGCVPSRHGVARRLVRDPEAFTLRLEFGPLAPVEVPLEQSQPVNEMPSS